MLRTLSPEKSQNSRNRLFYNAIRSAKSIQIQPIIANLINIRKITNKSDWFELGNYIDALLMPY